MQRDNSKRKIGTGLLAAITLTACAVTYEREYLTEINPSGRQISAFQEYGPPNSGPGYAGVQNNEPFAVCVAWQSSGPYFRVEPGQDLYHPMRGAALTGVSISDDLSEC
jgi:hypothetical protein